MSLRLFPKFDLRSRIVCFLTLCPVKNPSTGSVLNGIFILVFAVSASLAAAQDKPFFSAQYPAAGVSLPQTSIGAAETPVPRARNSRVVSSDDFKGEQSGAAPTGQIGQTVRPPNLTQYGVDFDKRHPGLWGPQADLDSIKQQLDQAQPSPTSSPSATPSPTPSPTPVRNKIGRRVYIVNPNTATLQPAANPSATPVIILVQPQH
jgi:hypothetical protein